MGKKSKKQSTYVTAQTFKIHKNKSFSANLSQYTKLLKAKYSNIQTSQYLKRIHRYIKEYSKKKGKLPQSLIVQTTSKIKICKFCDKWAMGTKKMIQCLLCEDYYHVQCAYKYERSKEWRCQSCIKVIKKTEDQAEFQQKTQKRSCFKCGENKNQVSIKCLKCNNFFHKRCYGKSHVVCEDCNKSIQTKIHKQRQLTLRQSFGISNQKKQKQNYSQIEIKMTKFQMFGNHQAFDKEQKKQRIGKEQINQSTNCTTLFSNSKRFRAKFPQMTYEEIQSYKQKLLFAIISKNMEYDQELRCHNCTLYEDNENSVDFAIQHLSFSDTKMFNQYKKQPIGPFLLQYSQICGYDVIADKDLPKGMIICQYSGDVYKHRDVIQLQQKNDSIMQLTIGKNSEQTLLIVPRKYTNIARFLNGINDKDPKRHEKQNVGTVRALIKGRPVVILYTSRDVKRGESLMYNYGAGLVESKYDTSYYQ